MLWWDSFCDWLTFTTMGFSFISISPACRGNSLIVNGSVNWPLDCCCLVNSIFVKKIEYLIFRSTLVVSFKIRRTSFRDTSVRSSLSRNPETVIYQNIFYYKKSTRSQSKTYQSKKQLKQIHKHLFSSFPLQFNTHKSARGWIYVHLGCVGQTRNGLGFYYI